MKKYLLPLLILCMVMICCPFAVAAEEPEPNRIIRAEEVAVSSSSETDVTLALTIENNLGIGGLEISVSFDESVTLVGAEPGEALSALDYVKPSYYRNPTNFVWDAQEIKEEDIKDGTLLELTFHIPAGLEGDFPVMVTYKPGTAYDKDLNPVELTMVNGNITVVPYVFGDADGDGSLNTWDITSIRRYISDGRKTDPLGYNVVINESAADVDGGGSVDTRDITLIRRYISDGKKTDPLGYNVVLKPGKMSCEHELTATAAVEPTCFEPGNIAYWYCSKCDKYFLDAETKYETILDNTVVNATGHIYEEAWSYDENYHWYDAACDHKEEIKDTAEHTFVDHKCSVCGANEVVTVTFEDYAGSAIKMQQVPYGTAATAPAEIPAREGYILDGWDKSFSNVTEDMTVTAKYAKASTVTFVDHDGAVLKQELVKNGENGTAYVFGQDKLPPEGYKRTGWDKTFNNVKEDITVRATYVRETYTVTFRQPDGTLIDKKTVEHGSDVEEPNHSEWYFDWSNYRMGSFSGWDKSLKAIKNDVIITAQYQGDFDQPIITIETTSNSASIKLYAPQGCYLYAIDFGFSWSGDIAIKDCVKNTGSALYKGKDGGYNVDYNNKYNTFHYTWADAAGVGLTGDYITILDINFDIDGGYVVNKDVLKLFSDCTIIFGSESGANINNLQTIAPIIVKK